MLQGPQQRRHGRSADLDAPVPLPLRDPVARPGLGPVRRPAGPVEDFPCQAPPRRVPVQQSRSQWLRGGSHDPHQRFRGGLANVLVRIAEGRHQTLCGPRIGDLAESLGGSPADDLVPVLEGGDQRFHGGGTEPDALIPIAFLDPVVGRSGLAPLRRRADLRERPGRGLADGSARVREGDVQDLDGGCAADRAEGLDRGLADNGARVLQGDLEGCEGRRADVAENPGGGLADVVAGILEGRREELDGGCAYLAQRLGRRLAARLRCMTIQDEGEERSYRGRVAAPGERPGRSLADAGVLFVPQRVDEAGYIAPGL